MQAHPNKHQPKVPRTRIPRNRLIVCMTIVQMTPSTPLWRTTGIAGRKEALLDNLTNHETAATLLPRITRAAGPA